MIHHDKGVLKSLLAFLQPFEFVTILFRFSDVTNKLINFFCLQECCSNLFLDEIIDAEIHMLQLISHRAWTFYCQQSYAFCHPRVSSASKKLASNLSSILQVKLKYLLKSYIFAHPNPISAIISRESKVLVFLNALTSKNLRLHKAASD